MISKDASWFGFLSDGTMNNGDRQAFDPVDGAGAIGVKSSGECGCVGNNCQCGSSKQPGSLLDRAKQSVSARLDKIMAMVDEVRPYIDRAITEGKFRLTISRQNSSAVNTILSAILSCPFDITFSKKTEYDQWRFNELIDNYGLSRDDVFRNFLNADCGVLEAAEMPVPTCNPAAVGLSGDGAMVMDCVTTDCISNWWRLIYRHCVNWGSQAADGENPINCHCEEYDLKPAVGWLLAAAIAVLIVKNAKLIYDTIKGLLSSLTPVLLS